MKIKDIYSSLTTGSSYRRILDTAAQVKIDNRSQPVDLRKGVATACSYNPKITPAFLLALVLLPLAWVQQTAVVNPPTAIAFTPSARATAAQSLPSPFDPIKQANPPPIAEEYYKKAGVLHRQRDYAGELAWDMKAAELGHARAQNDLGFLYANGFGVSRDYTKALYWWSKSAEQGDSAAERALALMYSLGLGGLQQNYNRVGDWLMRAAEHGNVQAMYEWGRLLSKPIVLPIPDKNGALYWLDEAAKRGHPNAAQLAAKLQQEWQSEEPAATGQADETPIKAAERACGPHPFPGISGATAWAAYSICINHWLRGHGYAVPQF